MGPPPTRHPLPFSAESQASSRKSHQPHLPHHNGQSLNPFACLAFQAHCPLWLKATVQLGLHTKQEEMTNP